MFPTFSLGVIPLLFKEIKISVTVLKEKAKNVDE